MENRKSAVIRASAAVMAYKSVLDDDQHDIEAVLELLICDLHHLCSEDGVNLCFDAVAEIGRFTYSMECVMDDQGVTPEQAFDMVLVGNDGWNAQKVARLRWEMENEECPS